MNVDEAAVLLVEFADPITVVFTDVGVPGGHDGFDLAPISAVRWPDIAVLITSGRADPAPDPPQAAVLIRKPLSAEVTSRPPAGDAPRPQQASAFEAVR